MPSSREDLATQNVRDSGTQSQSHGQHSIWKSKYSKREIIKAVLKDRGRTQQDMYYNCIFGGTRFERQLPNFLAPLKHASMRWFLSFKAIISIILGRINDWNSYYKDYSFSLFVGIYNVAEFDWKRVGGYFYPEEYDCSIVAVPEGWRNWKVFIYEN